MNTGATQMQTELRTSQMYPGCFRISNGAHFGHVKKAGKKWHAEIRRSQDGALCQYAGIWSRKSDVVEEVESLLRDVRYRA
jgi:hypothetical protein